MENKQMIPVIFDNSIDWIEDDEICLPETLPYIAGTTVMVCKYPMPANIKPKRLVVIEQREDIQNLCIKPAIVSMKTAEYLGLNQTDMIIITETETDPNKKYEPVFMNSSVSDSSLFSVSDIDNINLDKVFGTNACDKPEPDNPPKFINRPVPNPDYFKIGEAYHIHRNPSEPIRSVFGYYNDTPGADWVGILFNISENCLTFACYFEHVKGLMDINVSFNDIGNGPGKTDIIRLSNVLNIDDDKKHFDDIPLKYQCINQDQPETQQSFNQKIINHPRVNTNNVFKFGIILQEDVCSENFGLSESTRLMIIRALSLNNLPYTVESLIQLMVQYPDKNVFIENIYGIGVKRMEEIIHVLYVHGIQIEGYTNL